MYIMVPLKNKVLYRLMQIFPIWRDRGNKEGKRGKKKKEILAEVSLF